MIQRKDSLCFMEFIRGKFDLVQVDYITQLLSGMTVRERDMLLATPFEELWNHVWYQPSMPRYTMEYDQAKAKFDSLLHGYQVDQRLITLAGLLSHSSTPYQEPEWGFPKGRRRIKEDDIDCAIREFSEETGIVKEDLDIVTSIPPFEEIFFGTNHVLYRHVYYVARIKRNADAHMYVDPSNVNQAREVRAIRWFHSDDILSHIRSHNNERKQLFIQAHNRILALDPTFKGILR
jgi:8-oxo-dGTP pyrophosphatase MutT (NUDIX family)